MVLVLISFNPELRQDSMTGLVYDPYHWITHNTCYTSINFVVSIRFIPSNRQW